ncbi:MAG: repair protein RadC [Patescibacteria group bacterium]|nr:repair protein RadC [Patescibacteria group bacterium]
MTKYAFKNLEPMIAVSDGMRPYILKFRDQPNDKKPRETMLREGPAALSMAELLAVMINIGTKKEDVMEMASRVLKQYGEKSIANARDPKRLSKDLGIPEGKATQIVASVEFGRRLFEKGSSGQKMIRTARDVYEFTKSIRDLPREHLRGIYLNNHYKVIRDETISVGTVDAHLVHPRDVFKPAIDYGAVAVILVHNHPSGNTKPSKADIEITEQLRAVGTVLGIELIDHIIVSDKGFTSIMENS